MLLVKSIVYKKVEIMDKITGEYWIINGRADFADGDTGDKNHEMIAMDHICSENLDRIYNCAKELNLNIPSSSSMEDEPTESVHSLLSLIFEKLKSWDEVQKECGIDTETLKVITDGKSDPRLYVMKREGWVAVRSNNIELYGLDERKLKELGSGLDDIIDQESGWLEDTNDEELEFNLYDHKNNKSISLTLQDIKDKSVFRPQTLPQTTYNRLAVPAVKGKMYGRELWRGTSENVNFKNWLGLLENFQLNEWKHMQNNSAACEHCKQSLKVVDVIIGKHMFPVGQLFECSCKKSKVFTNTIRNIENLLEYIDGKRPNYSNGFCNDKKCGKCFAYITPLFNGVNVPKEMELSIHDIRADRYGCLKCPENQNILIIGQAFLPEGDKTSSQFIDFYTKHKNKIETLKTGFL